MEEWGTGCLSWVRCGVECRAVRNSAAGYFVTCLTEAPAEMNHEPLEHSATFIDECSHGLKNVKRRGVLIVIEDFETLATSHMSKCRSPPLTKGGLLFHAGFTDNFGKDVRRL
jgi:hypothetical protein